MAALEVGMVERGKLQIEELHIEVLRPFKVADVNDVVLQLGCGDCGFPSMGIHGSASQVMPPLRQTADCDCRRARRIDESIEASQLGAAESVFRR